MTSVTVNAAQSRLMHSINCWRRQGELITFIGFVANAWSLGRQVPFQWQAETERSFKRTEQQARGSGAPEAWPTKSPGFDPLSTLPSSRPLQVANDIPVYPATTLQYNLTLLLIENQGTAYSAFYRRKHGRTFEFSPYRSAS
ncbi:hypothetical protein QFC20_004908 [Naganishia adeliensis]|uniref:Uncharacterized protein n=1 Tax=Naganishia adeliensis TaxID=92952 RepID=A0ACC2VTZ3_9TREE|nr:hypothetical protein QFC20_004908 [Naganishia adeliensis]